MDRLSFAPVTVGPRLQAGDVLNISGREYRINSLQPRGRNVSCSEVGVYGAREFT